MNCRVALGLGLTFAALAGATLWVPYRTSAAYMAKGEAAVEQYASRTAQMLDDPERLVQQLARVTADVERVAAEVESLTGESVTVPPAPALPPTTPSPIASPPRQDCDPTRFPVIGYQWVWNVRVVGPVYGVSMYEVAWARVALTHALLLILGGGLLTWVVRRERRRRATLT